MKNNVKQFMLLCVLSRSRLLDFQGPTKTSFFLEHFDFPATFFHRKFFFSKNWKAAEK